MISLACRRVITSDIARPTTAPTASAAANAAMTLPVAAETSTADQRAGEHHRFQSDIDEAADCD